MSKTVQFEIVTPERVVYQDEITQVSVPTPLGEITILPNHIPLISSISPGEIRVVKEKSEEFMAISGGFIEVTAKRVVILADTAERAEEIDVQRSEEAKKRAEELLKDKKVDAVEYTALMAKINKELARLRVSRRRKQRRTTPEG